MQPPIISSNLRIRHPDHFHVGEGSIVDDFSYFSTKVIVGRYAHMASCCTVAGGLERTFTLGDFSSVSAGVRIWCTSDNFALDLVTIIPADFPPIKEHLLEGDVRLANMTAVGSNSVILPDNDIPEGAAIGAQSFVPAGFNFEPWKVYAGVPIRVVRERDRDSVLRQRDKFLKCLEQRETSNRRNR